MRLGLVLPLLAGVALAQNPPPTPAPAPPKSDNWTVEAPPSNPTGDPIQFKMALSPDKAHHLVTLTSQSVTTPQGAVESAIGIDARLHFTHKLDGGGAAFEMPIHFTKFVSRGRDVLAQVQQNVSEPKLLGKVDTDGVVVPGSVTSSGLGQIGTLEGSIVATIPHWPKKAVRVGQTWETPIERYTRSLKSLTGGADLKGSAYQTLEKLEDHDGVKCGVVHLVYAANFSKDGVPLPSGGTAKETLHVKGEGRMYYGTDGYLHGLDVSYKLALDLVPSMGQARHISVETKRATTGGPEDVAAAPAPTTPSKAGGEKGEKGESGATPEKPEKPEKPGADDDGDTGGDR